MIEVVERNPLQWLKDNEGIDLDTPLVDNERVELQAFSALLDPLLSDATQFTLWMEADNYGAAVEAYCGHLPWPLTAILGWQKHRGVQQCFKQGAMKEVKDSSRVSSGGLLLHRFHLLSQDFYHLLCPHLMGLWISIACLCFSQ